MADYIDDVRKYDPDADPEMVDKIVKRLGIALRSRDASLVSCSSQSELKTVKDKWCKARLDLDDAATDDVVEKVCTQMKDGRAKSRVTFYYLCAKHSGTMDKVRAL